MRLGLARVFRIAQTPDAVAIEDKNLTVADRERHRLVQAGGKAAPAHRAARFVQSADHPHVAVHRHADARAVRQELDVAEAHIATPWVFERQCDVVHHVGVLRGRGLHRGDDLL